MEKTEFKYNDGSFMYKHNCTHCNTGATYLGPKRRVDGYCEKCLVAKKRVASQIASTVKRDMKLQAKLHSLLNICSYVNKDVLQSLFDYHIEGVLTWKDTFGPKMQKGNIAGSFNPLGYKQVSINNAKYSIHRLIYIYHNGDIPNDLVIDHIDRDTTNNRIENLRLVTKEENAQNTLPTGAVFHKSLGKWLARIQVNGDVKYLGSFITKEEAQEVYYKAKLKYHIKD